MEQFNEMEAEKLQKELERLKEKYPTSDYKQTISSLEQKTVPTQISEQGGSSRRYNSEYRVALLLAKLITILGWIVFVIGLVMIVVRFMSSFSYGMGMLVAGVINGFWTSCCGLFVIVSGQMMRALIDTADNTRKILISINERKI